MQKTTAEIISERFKLGTTLGNAIRTSNKPLREITKEQEARMIRRSKWEGLNFSWSTPLNEKIMETVTIESVPGYIVEQDRDSGIEFDELLFLLEPDYEYNRVFYSIVYLSA